MEDADEYGLFVDMSALVKRGLRESQRDRGREGGRRERGRAGEREGRVGSEGRGMESVREIGRDRERRAEREPDERGQRKATGRTPPAGLYILPVS